MQKQDNEQQNTEFQGQQEHQENQEELGSGNFQFASIDGETISFELHNSLKNRLAEGIKHSTRLIKSPMMSGVGNNAESTNQQLMKRQIQNLQGYDSFEISSFGESKTFNGYIRFPSDNAPSLELDHNPLQHEEQQPEDQSQIKFSSLEVRDHKNKMEKAHKIHIQRHGEQPAKVDFGDKTERNPSTRSVAELEKEIHQLQLTLHRKQDTINRVQKTNQNLSKKLTRLQQTIHQQNSMLQTKQKVVNTLTAEIQILKKALEKEQFKNRKENSKQVLSEKTQLTNERQKANRFYPEILSPQESIRVLDILLKKVSKSAFMKKTVTKDQKIMQLLTQLVSSQASNNVFAQPSSAKASLKNTQ